MGWRWCNFLHMARFWCVLVVYGLRASWRPVCGAVSKVWGAPCRRKTQRRLSPQFALLCQSLEPSGNACLPELLSLLFPPRQDTAECGPIAGRIRLGQYVSLDQFVSLAPRICLTATWLHPHLRHIHSGTTGGLTNAFSCATRLLINV